MKNNNPGYIAYNEIAAMLKMYVWEVAMEFCVSRRINRLSSLMNFLHTNLELNPKNCASRFLTVERHGHLITIKLMEANNRNYLDIWFFRCRKDSEDVSDQLETYFTKKEFCKKLENKKENKQSIRAIFAIANHSFPLHRLKDKGRYVVFRSEWLKMTTMTIFGCDETKTYCLS